MLQESALIDQKKIVPEVNVVPLQSQHILFIPRGFHQACYLERSFIMGDRQHYANSVPQEGSIENCKVIRLEPAFCILQLLDYRYMRGLLHVSEMSLNGAKVVEVMSLDDVLYCKVLSVSTEEGP
jgi:hypothetical protein